ncbi:PPOX class F420-dependent oxidoreductase [Streptomyces sp. 4N509B]|uniref:PPOX class F420-dependent oxidoreductase n=1 Tax=Streptomyces sp. 4N509B TaxID=3457413 RepID=UPI003FD06D62
MTEIANENAGGAGAQRVTFDAATRELLDGKNFATVATLLASGAPQTSVVWLGREEDTVVFSTRADRQKARNLRRDPRVSVTLFDSANPYRSVEIRGRAELEEDQEKELGRRLSHKYLGEDPPPEPDDVVRLVVRVRPERVISFSV